MVEKDWGYLGQRCNACGQLLERIKTKTAQGQSQWALACPSHGRFTHWFLDAEDALYGTAFKVRPLKTEPARPKGTREWVPPEPGVVQPRQASGQEVVEDHLQAIADRERRMLASARAKLEGKKWDGR